MVRFKVKISPCRFFSSSLTVPGIAKNRWLLVEFISAGLNRDKTTHLDVKQISSALKQSVLVNFGDIGWGSVDLSLSSMFLLQIT
jgi:ribonuclease P/MRP protein subunit POP5